MAADRIAASPDCSSYIAWPLSSGPSWNRWSTLSSSVCVAGELMSRKRGAAGISGRADLGALPMASCNVFRSARLKT